MTSDRPQIPNKSMLLPKSQEFEAKLLLMGWRRDSVYPQLWVAPWRSVPLRPQEAWLAAELITQEEYKETFS